VPHAKTMIARETQSAPQKETDPFGSAIRD